MKFGARLKTLRKEQGLTLDRLSRLSGIAKATLSRLENDIVIGNLKTHMKICEALNISLGELYQAIQNQTSSVSSVKSRKTDEAEVFSGDRKTTSIILSQKKQNKNMLPQLLAIERGGKTHTEQNSLGTEKFVYCLEGELELTLENRPYGLKKGSSIYFKSSLPHFLKNTGLKTTRAIVVTSPAAL